MSDNDYYERASTCLNRVSAWADKVDEEAIDVMTSDGLVAIEFEDGTKYVLNRQSGNGQMWFAAGARAWHYGWDPQRSQWIDDRDGHLLKQRIAEVVSKKLGREVSLP
jgi:CyaY protein